MRGPVVRAALLALLAPLAVGGAFGHIDGIEALSHGTQLFAPDHPAHAPFVPEKYHPCASCAVANVLQPASAPLFLAPPLVCLFPKSRADRSSPAPILPDLPARSPPSPAA